LLTEPILKTVSGVTATSCSERDAGYVLASHLGRNKPVHLVCERRCRFGRLRFNGRELRNDNKGEY
jgi:hypothetical protein